MRLSLIPLLCCPKCKAQVSAQTVRNESKIRPESSLRLAEEFKGETFGDDRKIVDGLLRCEKDPSHHFKIQKGIPRFVPAENYASSFGLQWNVFRTTQFDSKNKTGIFKKRFFSITGLSPEDLKGKIVIDAGCGPGAFTDLVAPYAKLVIGIDLSNAVEAYQDNFKNQDNVEVLQADLFQLPLKREIADFVYSIGVLQHTPDPKRAYSSLPPLVRPGGRLAIWNYPKSLKYFFSPRFFNRLFFHRMNPEKVFSWLKFYVPVALKARDRFRKLPGGKFLEKAVFVCDYRETYPLSPQQVEEWALMDTFDSLATRYEIRLGSEQYEKLGKQLGLVPLERRMDGTGPALVFEKPA